MNRLTYVWFGLVAVIIVLLGAYAAWYTQHREEIITEFARCDYQLAHPETAPKVRAPDGTMVPLMTTCKLGVTPPSLLNLVRGDIVFTDVPSRMQVNPYTFWDVLLARYSVTPITGAPCDQSATTTNCAALMEQNPRPLSPQMPASPSVSPSVR